MEGLRRRWLKLGWRPRAPLAPETSHFPLPPRTALDAVFISHMKLAHALRTSQQQLNPSFTPTSTSSLPDPIVHSFLLHLAPQYPLNV